jgi:hypothetical protein
MSLLVVVVFVVMVVVVDIVVVVVAVFHFGHHIVNVWDCEDGDYYYSHSHN